jgi:RNA polymerase sigma-70 factor (ECF subfamily)
MFLQICELLPCVLAEWLLPTLNGTVRDLSELEKVFSARLTPFSTHIAARTARSQLGGMMAHHCALSLELRQRTLSSGIEKQQADLSEMEAIRRTQCGDASAFEHLYRLHSPRIHALCFRMTSNPSEAEDLTQEAFLVVFRKIHTFRGASAFSTWLYRVAVNVVLMRLRSKNLRSASFSEGRTVPKERDNAASEVAVPDLALAGLVDRVCLERALARLTRTHRTIFILHDVQGFKHREIAEMMDCSVGTSKTQLHRARRQLRDLLRESVDSLAAVSETAAPRNQCSPSY